jgi:hypothetical protein
MERSGFPLSSRHALDTSLQFLIQALSLLTQASFVSLPPLKVDILGCVAINVTPLY